jgi:ABC-type uncharacterized transport system ATPase subunit
MQIRAEGGINVLREVPGVEAIRDLGQMQELRLARNTDPQAVLRAIVMRHPVHSFAITQPSLHDIFVRIAGAPAEEEKHA